MKRSLTVLSRSLFTSLMLFLPTGLLQASILSVPEKTAPIHREGKIIAQLPGFQPDFNVAGFEPNKNSFNFSNSDLTNVLKKTYIVENFENNDDWKEYFQGTLLWFFGSKVCLNEDDIKDIVKDYKKCRLTAPAKEWLKQNIRSMEDGLCEGIATASLYLWLWQKDPVLYAKRTNFYTDPEDENEFKKLLKTNPINSLTPDESELQAYITNLFILQSLTRVYNSTAAIRNEEKPSQILERLIGSMRLNPYDPYTMGIYQAEEDKKNSGTSEQENDTHNYKLTKGHSLVPFAVKEQGNGIYWVYVYDSNYPGKSPYVIFNTQTEEWSYQPDRSALPYKGDAKKKNLDLTRLSLRDLKPTEYFDCPFCNDESNKSTGTQAVEISLVGQGDLSVTDLEGNEIPGVYVVPFKGGLGKDVPPSLHIPPTQSSQPFKITLRATAEDNDASVVMVGSGFTVGFENITLQPNEKLTMYVYPGQDGPKVSFEADDEKTIPTLFFSLNDDSIDTGYEFEISNIQLAPGKLMQVVADTERKRFYFGDNDGTNNEYNLKMRFTTDEENYYYEYEVKIPQLQAEKIAYFAYMEWIANLYRKGSEISFENAFYEAKFQPLGRNFGSAFNEDTISKPDRINRNSISIRPQGNQPQAPSKPRNP